MTIDLTHDTESQLRDSARAQGLSVSEYLERLLTETRLRSSQLSEFHEAVQERMTSLDAGETVDGEQVMARLIAEPPPR